MLKITHASLGILLILIALFLWFALAFNGGVGETFVNYSFFTSAFLILGLGISKIAGAPNKVAVSLGIAGVILYMPMIWQRFNFKSGLDNGGLCFDLVIMVIVILSVLFKPNKARNPMATPQVR
jgi:O-antigen ligase